MQNLELEQIKKLTQKDLELVKNKLLASLPSNQPLIDELPNHLTGGKKLRPMLVVLTAKALNYQGEKHIHLATAIEMLHIASLLHDDVLDDAKIRRDKATINATKGNKASILLGDFLYSKAFEILSEINNSEITKIVAKATNDLVLGELLQLKAIQNTKLTKEEYFTIVYHKTACLFEGALLGAALLSNANNQEIQALKNFANFTGKAFQMIDDLLDYDLTAIKLGKTKGNDFKEGKITLPIILTLQNATTAQQEFIKNALANTKDFEQVVEIMQKYQIFKTIKIEAQNLAKQAQNELKQLQSNNYQKALQNLAQYFINRDF